LDAARIEPKLKTALEYNIRRRHWEEEIPALKIGVKNLLRSEYFWKRFGILLLPLLLITKSIFIFSLLIAGALPIVAFLLLIFKVESVPASEQPLLVKKKKRVQTKRSLVESVIEWMRAEVVGFILLTSDYGKSTKHVLAAFLLCSFAFAAIYYGTSESGNTILTNLDFGKHEEPVVTEGATEIQSEGVVFSSRHKFVRALYFSVVTMTTLGFGDVTPVLDPETPILSFLGYFYVMVQVVLGYLLLGALITRLGILFQANSS
ncbi:MAG: potassium channel family protein, partial [Pirellulaceae bacterium]|nr:potassium channel family protein [Pirellulaceae bacterium]